MTSSSISSKILYWALNGYKNYYSFLWRQRRMVQVMDMVRVLLLLQLNQLIYGCFNLTHFFRLLVAADFSLSRCEPKIHNLLTFISLKTPAQFRWIFFPSHLHRLILLHRLQSYFFVVRVRANLGVHFYEFFPCFWVAISLLILQRAWWVTWSFQSSH